MTKEKIHRTYDKLWEFLSVHKFICSKWPDCSNRDKYDSKWRRWTGYIDSGYEPHGELK